MSNSTDKEKEYKRNWRKRNPEWQRNYVKTEKGRFICRSIGTKYNITFEEYQELISKHNNLCAICLKKCSTGRNLAVDHDHKTKKVRGLLCRKCNVSLGMFLESPELLERAKNYLIQFERMKEGLDQSEQESK